ncbi:MAG: 1-deoxy-D-xylulose-5-phosphate reductoisomerase [Bacilli bacterium]|nr:1-deoxy-D-xylulose-5-phosphate reductoisomerase [Bacilli bacterium]
MRKILLLGASGSIGSQSLDIIEAAPERFSLTAFSVGYRVEKIPEILQKHINVSHICVRKEEDKERLEKEYPSIFWHCGDEGLKELCLFADYDMAVNALVGFSGLVPSLTVLNEDKILALANKESLVVGGELVNRILASGKGKLYPIDSEHVALAKMLDRVKREDVDRMIITASGGSFRNKSREELSSVTPEMALNHPTWQMGAKITIDSATMMNKGFEVIEAMYLYRWPLEKIDIILHDESTVHSMLLMKDGSYVADISKPDMHGPILYAMYEKQVDYKVYTAKRIEDFGPFHFHRFKEERYPAVGLAMQAIKTGGTAPAVLNAANEEAIHLFLDGKIPFLSIEPFVASALRHVSVQKNPSLRDILAADSYARLFIQRKAEGGI